MAEPLIKWTDVSFTYRGDVLVHALHPTSMQIDSTDYVAITGPSGSGKSTLLSVLGLLASPTSGSYEIAGVETAILGEHELAAVRAARIGFVFQSFHLVEGRDIIDNVRLGMIYGNIPAEEQDWRAREACDRVGLGHRSSHFPAELSGGERQRVAIARAIAKQPAVLLADEPTGNLDSRTTSSILDLLDELNEAGQTIVCVTHDAVVADRASSHYEMSDGTLSMTRSKAQVP